MFCESWFVIIVNSTFDIYNRSDLNSLKYIPNVILYIISIFKFLSLVLSCIGTFFLCCTSTCVYTSQIVSSASTSFTWGMSRMSGILILSYRLKEVTDSFFFFFFFFFLTLFWASKNCSYLLNQIEMGFRSKCIILNGQVIYTDNWKLKAADMWLIPLDRVTILFTLRGYCTPGPYFWRLCPFSQKIKQLRTKYPMDLDRNVPRNSKITVLLQ